MAAGLTDEKTPIGHSLNSGAAHKDGFEVYRWRVIT